MVRALAFALAPFAVATLVGLVWLWPRAEPAASLIGPPGRALRATVVAVQEIACPELQGQGEFRCARATARLDEGPDAGLEVTFELAEGPTTRRLRAGDGILLTRASEGPPELAYAFMDYQRARPLLLLGVLFAAVVIALSRRRGLAALAGLALSLAVLIFFVLPAILAGEPPLAVAVVGAAVIMFAAIYLAHGFNVRSSTAILGTLISLLLTGILALIFVEAARFTGFGSEEAVFLQVSASQINLTGLLLGGIVIGSLGVLDDVTVTQASAVWELHRANPKLGARGLYAAAIRIGRDHIASTVNTLVLAYAGAALPLMIVFTLSNQRLSTVLTSEVVAEEIVRTLVGSIGLVASVPITTGLAALVVSYDSERSGDDYQPPRAERDWRVEI